MSKIKIITAAMLFTVLAGFSATSSAEDMVDSLFKGLKQYLRTDSLVPVCEKASLFGGKFTIRSGEGRLCASPLVGAFAQIICPKIVKDFTGSGCDKKATAALKGVKPSAYIKDKLRAVADPINNAVCNAIVKVVGETVASFMCTIK